MSVGLARACTVAAGLSLAGCASVTGGNVQKMYVQAMGSDGKVVEGAECRLSNDKGSWQLRSPGETTVVRSNRRMDVHCAKPPLPSGDVSVESTTRDAMFGNLVLGGPVGAVIDHSSGAAYQYPELVQVVMGAYGVPPSPTAARPAPAAVTATAAATETAPYLATPVAASAAPRSLKIHARAVPPASGYAASNNADAVPVRGEGKERYLHYLTLPSPKAFVVYETGGWRYRYGATDAMVDLLDQCAREGRRCWLYAVDNVVVWQRDVGQRVGRSDQLAPSMP